MNRVSFAKHILAIRLFLGWFVLSQAVRQPHSPPSQRQRYLRGEDGASFNSVNAHLPKCKLYEDTVGSWKKISAVNTSAMALREFETAHFFHGGAGHALEFDSIWVPNGCSYHRFTNETIKKCLDYDYAKRQADPKLAKETKAKPFEIVFMGDSALRGIVCGISRILQGDEVYGPLGNVICGYNEVMHPISTSLAGHPYTFQSSTLTPHLDLTFTYVTTFERNHFDWKLEWEVEDERPRVLVMNTGAWDFDDIAREMNSRGVVAEDRCQWANQTAVAEHRADDFVNHTVVHELGDIGARHGVRLIYRNNHHNCRFGPTCADERLEALMAKHSQWEVWDNKGITKDVWVNQTWDGFHFDRHRVYSVEHHKMNIEQWHASGREAPGAMEMQLAQSLLNAVFHDCLENHFHH